MKILFIYRHFWPDNPPYASMLRSIAASLVEAGHIVEIWTEMPSYGDAAIDTQCDAHEVIDGISVLRLARLPGMKKFGVVRQLAKIVFPLRILVLSIRRRVFGCRCNVVVAATIPPVANGLAALVSSKILGARFIYHMQDIYPEVGACVGLWSDDSLVSKGLGYLDGMVCSIADVIVVLSRDMKASIEARNIEASKIHVINNFELQSFSEKFAATTNSSDQHIDKKFFNIVFAGNIGRFQGLKVVVECARRLVDIDKLRITLIGDGVAKKELEAASNNLSNIVFVPHLSTESAKMNIEVADIGLVTLGENIYKYAYPSKTLTYLGLGVPVLTVVENSSDISEFVVKKNIGYTADNRSVDELESVMRKAFLHRDQLSVIRGNVKSVYESELSVNARLQDWIALVGRLK